LPPPPTRVVPHVPARLVAPALPLLFAIVAGCGMRDLPPPEVAGTLVVAVRPGPVTWFPAADGGFQGLDHDLIARFAHERGLPLTLVEVDDAEDLLRTVAEGGAHVGLGGLHRPPPGRSRARDTTDASLRWTRGYAPLDLVVVCSRDGHRPRDWRDLAQVAVAYDEESGVETALARLRGEHPEVRWHPMRLPSPESLLALVDEGRVSCAIVSSVDAAAARNIYLDIAIGFSLNVKRELAWAVGGRYDALAADLDRFLDAARRDGTLARLAQRYFAPPGDVAQPDAGAFQDRIREDLATWRPMFHAAQDATGVEWRLLAAVAYQESQWDPGAVSETGVRGFMQITEETARHLGMTDRLDVSQNIMAAARYLRDLKAKLPSRIAEPDRTWMALAAFNIGMGHLEDARILAQKQGLNPDLWNDVRRALPLLAQPAFHETTRLGYARGGMPVAFVDRVRGYYDILLRTQPAHAPRLRSASAQAGP